MKKILSIALVALLAACTVFAGFSGKATLSLGYDTTSKAYGFTNGKGTSATIELAADTAEVVGEGDIYAGIKATMQLAVKPSEGGAKNIYDTTAGEGFGIWMSVKDAYIAGQDWKVSILGTKGAPDYAESALDGDYYLVVKDSFGTYYDYAWVPTSYALNVWKDSAITVTYKGFTIAGGFQGDNDGDANANIVDSKREAWNAFNFFVETPAFEFDGGSAQVAAIVGSNGAKTDVKVSPVSGKDYYAYTNLDEIMIGVSAKASYATDAFSAAVAADFGIEDVADAAQFNFDAAANVAYAPVSADVYFSRVDDVNYLSAKVAAEYEGISGDVYAKDILSEDITIGADAEYTLDAVTVGAGFWMTTKSKDMEVSANVKYAPEKFTAKVGATFGTNLETENKAYFFMTGSVESDAIINGATLSLAYGKDSTKKDMNFLADQDTTQNFGAVTAKCTIAF
ncbi:MAG: hypothetical protein ACI4SL_03755 [Candidatus Ornithospirochaeta sp.]